jgi:hypothetical protein
LPDIVLLPSSYHLIDIWMNEYLNTQTISKLKYEYVCPGYLFNSCLFEFIKLAPTNGSIICLLAINKQPSTDESSSSSYSYWVKAAADGILQV